MTVEKILELRSDGAPNMAVDGGFLYIRCDREMHRYDLADMRLTARNAVFKKDGRARGFSIFGDLLFLHDFLDLYILDKHDLRVKRIARLGADASSDIGGVMCFDPPRACVKMRNGRICVLDADTGAVERFELCDSSFWGDCAAGGSLFAGTVRGELLEIDKLQMRVVRKMDLCGKNIYALAHGDGLIYAVSQDGTIRTVDAATFEPVCTARRAVRGMARLLGSCGDDLVAADSGQISLWDAKTLRSRVRFDFPVGAYNKSAMLSGNRLFGGDAEGIYRVIIG